MTKEERHAYNTAYRSRNREKVNAQARKDYANSAEKYRARMRKYASEHREEYQARRKRWIASGGVADLASRRVPQRILTRIKTRAKRAGIPFDLTVADVVVPATCPVLGIPLIISGTKAERDHAPSVDRLNPDLGYVRGNVMVVSFRANRWKSDMRLADMQRLVEFYQPLL